MIRIRIINSLLGESLFPTKCMGYGLIAKSNGCLKHSAQVFFIFCMLMTCIVKGTYIGRYSSKLDKFYGQYKKCTSIKSSISTTVPMTTHFESWANICTGECTEALAPRNADYRHGVLCMRRVHYIKHFFMECSFFLNTFSSIFLKLFR